MASPSRADQFGPGFERFSAVLKKLESGGTEPAWQVLFEAGRDQSALDSTVLTKLENIAREQAQIWADTILEGDYEASGETRLERVEALRDATQAIVAYRIVYSEQAWYTGDCDTESDPTRRTCEEGTITESTFVSPDFLSWVRDDRAMAEFSVTR